MGPQTGFGFLHHNIRLLRTIGLWPLDTESRYFLMLNLLYIVFLIFSLAVVSVCQVIQIFVSPNIASMASVVDMVTLTASALFKMIYILWYRSYFQALVEKIDSTFVPKDFTVGNLCMTKWMKNYKTYINLYILMGATTTLGFGLPPYIISYYFKDAQKYDNVDYGAGELAHFDEEREFPFNCWYPFDVTWSPLYEIVYLVELVPMIACGHIYLVTDAFFFMIIYMICGQLELLKASFKGMEEKLAPSRHDDYVTEDNVDNYKRRSVKSPILREFCLQDKQLESEMNKVLVKCVDFHNDIIEIIIKLDSLLRSMVIVDFLHAVISLSFAMLQLVTSTSGYDLFKMCLFIVVCIIHQFLNNYFGEILMNQIVIYKQQMSVADVVYDTQWVDSTDLHKLTVYLTVKQANHPTRLSGWRMYNLGLSTFVEFMKLLGSYFLVLQSLQANEGRTRP